MSNLSIEQRAADALLQAQVSGQAIGPIRETIGADNIAAAYNIQKINTDKRIAQNEKVVGKKIGLTSFAVQKQLGVDQPDYGVLFDTMQVREGVVHYSHLQQPKAEAEIAFVLSEDLTRDVNMSDLINAIDYAAVSIEIVGSRIANWDIKITDTIADNASASHFILGESRVPLSQIDLEKCKMSLIRNGEVVSEGSGAACMDNPLNAALWLAQTMAEMGNPLKAGEVLLSGALGPMVPIEQGDKFEAVIEGLGSVQLAIV